jgi:hypothetical protein
MTCATVLQVGYSVSAGGVTTAKLVRMNANITVAGDSGAPWSSGALAYGVHRGICDYMSCFSTVQNAQATLGVAVKLS